MLKKWLILLLTVCSCTMAMAQIHVLDGDGTKSVEGVRCYLQDSAGFAYSDYLNIRDSTWNAASDLLSANARVNKTIWIRIPVPSRLNLHESFIVDIDNPHINYVRCWILRQDTILKEFPLTGDHLPFHSRAMPLPGFAFPLPAMENKDVVVLLALDKRLLKLDARIRLINENDFLRRQTIRQSGIGLFTGFLLLMLLLNVYLFFTGVHRLHGWYSLYLLTILLYTLSDSGLMYQWLFPDWQGSNDLMRPALLAISIVPALNFYENLLELYKTWPLVSGIIKKVSIGFVVLFILVFSMLHMDDYPLQRIWKTIFGILSPLLLLLFWGASIIAYRRKIRMALFAVISFSGICVFIGLFSLVENDVFSGNYFISQNGQYIAILFELVIMAIAMVYRFRLYKQDAEQIRKKYREQKERVIRELVDWQSREMKKISTYLHDTACTSLGMIRMENDYMELTEENRQQLSEKISLLGNDIRNMSHSFNTDLLKMKGLKRAVSEYTERINTLYPVQVELEWIGADNHISFHYEQAVYQIVQELLQNMLKHAKASKAHLQLITEDNLVYIYIEDNGNGAETHSMGNGIGLLNIEKLTTILDGRFSIFTKPGEGFAVSIEFNS